MRPTRPPRTMRPTRGPIGLAPVPREDFKGMEDVFLSEVYIDVDEPEEEEP